MTTFNKVLISAAIAAAIVYGFAKSPVGQNLGATQNSVNNRLTNIANLTSNGFVKTGGGNGTLSVDTSTYLTSSTGVSSITGTSDQIIASGATGAVTLSTPQSINTTSTPQFAKIGIGAAADASRLLLVTGDVSGGVATINRSNASTNAAVGTMIVKGTSTGDMVDGFGTAFQFAIQDNAGVENNIGNIQMVRAGADNTGTMSFVTTSAGSTFVNMLLHPTGVNITMNNDGGITFLGLGNGNDEALTWDYDNVSNEVAISSSTGVTEVDFDGTGGLSNIGINLGGNLNMAGNTSINTNNVHIATGGGTTANPNYEFTGGDANNGLQYVTTDTWAGVSNGTEKWRLNTAGFLLAAGTTTTYPVSFTTGTLMTTAAAGALEFNTGIFYASGVASSRQVIDAEQFIALTSGNTLTSQTAVQPMFDGGGGPAGGALTVAGSTSYQFECSFSLSSMSSSSGSFGFALGGTATLTSQTWYTNGNKATLATAATPQSTYNTAANVALTTATVATVGWAEVRGIVRINAAGTLIPQVSLGVAAAAVVDGNSFCRFWPVGSNTVVNVGNWS